MELRVALAAALVSLLSSSGAVAQNPQPGSPAAAGSPAVTASPEVWLARLSDLFVKDIDAGSVEAAILHHVQLQIAALPVTDSSGTQQAQAFRDRLIGMTKATAAEWIPNNPGATAPLLNEALLLQSAVAERDWSAVRTHIGDITLPLAKIASDASQARIQQLGSATGSSNSAGGLDPRDYIKLLNTVDGALRADDVLTAESYAPQLLRLTQELPGHNPSAYSTGLFISYDALGRGAFARGDYDAAKEFLCKAGETPPGSPRLHVDGPSMKLAAALFDKGYSQEVIDFLAASKTFWNSPLPDKWIAVIRSGKRPAFAPNVSW